MIMSAAYSPFENVNNGSGKVRVLSFRPKRSKEI
jgi:hypothetical protein